MYSTPWRTVLASNFSLVPDSSVDYNDWQEVNGFQRNSKGDLEICLNALATNAVIMVLAVLLFSVLRQLVPQVYSNNSRKGEDGGRESVSYIPSPSFFGWVRAGLEVDLKEVTQCSGLDAALLIEFTVLARRMLLAIGLPLLLVMGPLHYFCGGDRALKVGDSLSSIGLNNVVRGSWLFWLHAGIVWYVVVLAEEMLFESMARFLDIRFEWLLHFKPPQALTLLVENIPTRFRSDEALKDVFTTIFPGCVDSAYMVKDTGKLKRTVERLKAQRFKLEVLMYKKNDRNGLSVTNEQEMHELTFEVERLEDKARGERKKILKECGQGDPGMDSARVGKRLTMFADERLAEEAVSNNMFMRVAGTSGFVTFHSQRDALIALNMRLSADSDEFVMSIPPQPSDIIYEDLLMPKFRRRVWAFVGFSCIFLLFMFFLPIIMLISSITNLQALEKHSELVRTILHTYPQFHSMLEGVLSTLALVLMMSFLPTLLLLIFHNFFSLKAHAWGQLKLQRYYYFFLVTFILLATAVGNSLVGRALAIYNHPSTVFHILAEALPSATNFYIDLMLVQCMQHTINLTRYIQVIKYWSFRAILGEQRAGELSEPEDQDYYGIGARSARSALDLVIGIVFCNLSPVLTMLTAANFALGRLTYGYLLVFAETRKPDLGGPFFVQQLWQVQFGVMLYAVLMLSILLRRADHWGPPAIALGTIPYVIYCVRRFGLAFIWRDLPMMDICDADAMEASNERMDQYRASSDGRPPYMQPELIEDTWKSPEEPWVNPQKSDSSEDASEALGKA